MPRPHRSTRHCDAAEEIVEVRQLQLAAKSVDNSVVAQRQMDKVLDMRVVWQRQVPTGSMMHHITGSTIFQLFDKDVDNLFVAQRQIPYDTVTTPQVQTGADIPGDA